MPWLNRRRQVALAILMVTVLGTVAWLRYTVPWTPLQRQYLYACTGTALPFLGGDEIEVLVVLVSFTNS